MSRGEQKAKTLLAAMVWVARPVLMRCAWICLRSLIVWQVVSSIERKGWSEINFEIEVEGGLKEQKHGGIRLWICNRRRVCSLRKLR